MQNSLTEFNKALEKTLGLLEQLDGVVSGGAGGASGGMMNGSLAGFTQPPSRAAVAMQGAAIAVGAAAGMAQGVSSALPDVNMTLGRESGYYGAGVMSGFAMSRNQLESTTRLGLGKFQTSAGASAAVAATFAGQGVMPGTAKYSQMVTSVGQAARYLNIPNEVAAQAIGGLGTGPTSAMMLNSFGIFTSDPRTGQEYSQAQVFEQLAQRFTAGQGKASVEETMESLRRGALGSNIRNSGLDQTQQAMLSQFMIARAQGVQMDLSDPNAMDNLMKMGAEQGYQNPFMAAMELNAKNDEMMNRATQPYLEGVQAATDELVKLKDAMMGLPDEVYKFKAALETFAGDNTGGGLMSAAGSLLGGLGAGAMLYAGARGGSALGEAASGVGKGGGAKGTPASKGGFNMGMSVKKGLGRGFGIGALASIAGTVVGDMIAGDAEQGSTQSKIGNALSYGSAGAGIGAMVGSIVPGIGTGIGAAAGGIIGGVYGAFAGGYSDSFGQAGFSSTGGGFSAPVNGGFVSSQYGAQRANGSVHKGIDIALPEGTPVYAVAPGKVIASQMSTATSRSYGEYIEIRHSSEYTTLYAHLKKDSRRVNTGDSVTGGQQIAEVGSTGLSSGPHLHFEVRKNGAKVNPNTVLPEDLLGNGKDYSADNNGGSKSSGKQQGKQTTAASLLNLAVDPSAYGNAAISPISVSVSGIQGRSLSTNQILASSMGTGTIGISSPAAAALGTDGPSTGGSENYLPMAGTSSTSRTRKYTEDAEKSPAGKVVTNHVTIQLSVSNSSEDEAKKFAKYIKTYLEDETLMQNMGSR